MKKLCIIMLVIVLICIGVIFSLLLEINLIVKDDKQLIKDMTDTDYESTISELNNSHADYASHVETCKATIANAITDMGIQTSSDATVDTMATNIRSIVTDTPFTGCEKIHYFVATAAGQNGKNYTLTEDAEVLFISAYSSVISINGEGTLMEFGKLSQDNCYVVLGAKKGTTIVHTNPKAGSSGWPAIMILKLI